MSQIIEISGGARNANHSIFVDLGQYSVELELHYQQNGQWLMHVIADGDAGEIPLTIIDSVSCITLGAMLEPGVDIIEQSGISHLLGQLFIVGEDPTLDNLGIDNQLVWFSASERLSFE